MGELKRKIKMQKEVRTKGTVIKKGETVTLIDYPVSTRTGFYTEFATVEQKGYGRVSVPKYVIAKSVQNKILHDDYMAWRKAVKLYRKHTKK